MDNNMEPWEREWIDCEDTMAKGIDESTINIARKIRDKGESFATMNRAIGFYSAHIRQQARIDRICDVLQNLRNCAEEYAEHDLPAIIVTRIDAVLAEHITDTGKKESTDAS